MLQVVALIATICPGAKSTRSPDVVMPLYSITMVILTLGKGVVKKIGGGGRRWAGGDGRGGDAVEDDTLGRARSRTEGAELGGVSAPASASLKYRAICRRRVELRGPLSCCTAVGVDVILLNIKNIVKKYFNNILYLYKIKVPKLIIGAYFIICLFHYIVVTIGPQEFTL